MAPARLDSIFGAALSILRLDPRSDEDLLARFLEERDDSAFETLVMRHTPAVRAACRGWLRSPADIDDAAQATFLVLVQRARSIRYRHAIGRWLYGVAAKVARRLREQQRSVSLVPENLPSRDLAVWDDESDLVAEVVARLPEKYRLPVQLCYAAGLTTAEAASRLGWPKGTVLTRLAWARKRLRKDLTRRGLAPALVAGMAATVSPSVNGAWVRATARTAKCLLVGESPVNTGVSLGTISLTQGVVRAMLWNKLKYIALAVLVVVGLAGYGIGQWVSASDGPGGRKLAHDPTESRVAADKEPGNQAPTPTNEPAKKDESRPAAAGHSRQLVIQLPSGTYVKEIEAAPYGSGRLTWTYDDGRVVGLIEGSAMGFEFELAIEAEYSLSTTGTIYGIITGVRLNHIKLPDGDEFAQLKPYLGLWPAVEPLVNDALLDLPFSYQFRVRGDRLIINNYRILLAGPNPLGKLGGLAAAEHSNDLPFAVLAYFQALGTAIEGTYTADDAKDKPAPGKRSLFQKPRHQTQEKKN
jgi:RNA polymerase sigma factor (sigma-70 family)